MSANPKALPEFSSIVRATNFSYRFEHRRGVTVSTLPFTRAERRIARARSPVNAAMKAVSGPSFTFYTVHFFSNSLVSNWVLCQPFLKGFLIEGTFRNTTPRTVKPIPIATIVLMVSPKNIIPRNTPIPALK